MSWERFRSEYDHLGSERLQILPDQGRATKGPGPTEGLVPQLVNH